MVRSIRLTRLSSTSPGPTSTKVLTELSQNPELRIVERERIAELTEEDGLVDQGLVDPSTAAEIGRLVGARYMVMGSFTTFRAPAA